MFCSVWGSETSKNLLWTHIWGGGRAEGEEAEGRLCRGGWGEGSEFWLRMGTPFTQAGGDRSPLGQRHLECVQDLCLADAKTHMRLGGLHCPLARWPGEWRPFSSLDILPSPALVLTGPLPPAEGPLSPAVPRKATPLLSPWQLHGRLDGPRCGYHWWAGHREEPHS